MNIEYILMMSFYTLRSIVAFKSENSIKMALSRKIVRDVYDKVRDLCTHFKLSFFLTKIDRFS